MPDMQRQAQLMRLQTLGMNLLMRYALDAPRLFFSTRGDCVASEAAIALEAAERLHLEGPLELARRDLDRALRALLAARASGWIGGDCRDVQAGLDRAARCIAGRSIYVDGWHEDR